MRHCRKHCVVPVAAFIRARGRSGARRRNGAVRFVISVLRTNGQPKTGKSLRYNSRTGVRKPGPFRKHQVDCLRLWRLPSHGNLLRRLLAIFNIRGREEGPGAVTGLSCGGVSSEGGTRRRPGPSMRGCTRRTERMHHGHLVNARKHAALIPIHTRRRARRRPVSAKTKGWSRFIISRRNKASTGEWDPGHFSGHRAAQYSRVPPRSAQSPFIPAPSWTFRQSPTRNARATG